MLPSSGFLYGEYAIGRHVTRSSCFPIAEDDRETATFCDELLRWPDSVYERLGQDVFTSGRVVKSTTCSLSATRAVCSASRARRVLSCAQRHVLGVFGRRM